MNNDILTENLIFSYDQPDELPEQANLVLNGINLAVEKGSFVAVLGHNGSGKSTLAKHFNAILLPSGGKVYVTGMDTSDEHDLYRIRKNAGMVFQNPDNQIVAALVEDDVAFALENLGVPPHEIRSRVTWAMETVGMSAYARHEPHRLSGGQKQRVAIAGILAMQPQCIILDEPTAMLDPKGRDEVIQTVRKLNREQNLTVVLITHFMSEAALCDRVVVMDSGKIIMDAPPREVFRREAALKAVQLDVPQVTRLAHRLAEEGVPIADDILTVDECVEALSLLLHERDL